MMTLESLLEMFGNIKANTNRERFQERFLRP